MQKMTLNLLAAGKTQDEVVLRDCRRPMRLAQARILFFATSPGTEPNSLATECLKCPAGTASWAGIQCLPCPATSSAFLSNQTVCEVYVIVDTIGIAEAKGVHRDVAAAGTTLYGNSAVLPKLQPSFLRQEHLVLVLAAPSRLSFNANLKPVPLTTMSLVPSVAWCSPTVTTFNPSLFELIVEAEPYTLAFGFEDGTTITLRSVDLLHKTNFQIFTQDEDKVCVCGSTLQRHG